MRIVEMRWSLVEVPLHTPFAISSETTVATANWWVQVRLEDGTEGWGEAAPAPTLMGETTKTIAASLEEIRTLWVGQPAAWRPRIEQLQKHLGAQHTACAAAEIALLDALCKRRGIPLCEWMGGSTDSLETDVTVPIMPPEEAALFAQQFAAQGFRRLKIKLSGDTDEDEARIVAVSQVVPKAALQLDANQAYTAPDAWRLLQRLERRGIVPLLFEQPVPKDDWEGMRWLTERSFVPICADEMVVTAADALRLVREKAAHAINIKLMKSGIWEGQRIAALAQTARLALMIGAMVETELGLSAGAHFAAGIGGFAFVDLDTHLFLQQSPFTAGFNPCGPYLHLRLEPGLGVRLRKA